VLIIEDEPVIAMDLEGLLKDLGHRVVSIARTHTEAMVAMSRREPGLILADIQLADGSSGLDAVNEILEHCEVPVVFITAYPERLLTGERPEPFSLSSSRIGRRRCGLSSARRCSSNAPRMHQARPNPRSDGRCAAIRTQPERRGSRQDLRIRAHASAPARGGHNHHWIYAADLSGMLEGLIKTRELAPQ
jgi:CheY-like chemotaxis protein